ncbi:MAG: Flp family type IVb pilin [Pseudomonadota bacterium]
MILTTFLKHIGNDESGATAVEYGLIASLVVLAAMGGYQALGDQNDTGWGNLERRVTDAMGG